MARRQGHERMPTDNLRWISLMTSSLALNGRRWQSQPLIAMHPDFAIEWLDIPSEGDLPAAEIILYPEQIIRGKMIDAEGRPVPGATIAVRYLQAPKAGNSLDAILAERQKQMPPGPANVQYLGSDFLPESFAAVAEKNGQFEERAAWLPLPHLRDPDCGDGLHDDDAARRHPGGARPCNSQPAQTRDVRTRARPDGRPRRSRTSAVPGFPGKSKALVTGCRGGKPVANLDVGAAPMGTQLTFTTTDADGRYRLAGLPRGVQLSVSFAMSGHDDLLSQRVQLSPNADEGLKNVDVEMQRGLLVSGKVIDPLSDAKVAAVVTFFALPGNEYYGKAFNQDAVTNAMLARTDEQGSFRLAAIPGPGVLVVEAYGARGEGSPFLPATISPEDAAHIKPQTQPDGSRYFTLARGQAGLDRAHAVKYVNFSEDGGPQSVDLKLERGKSVELQIADSDGQPVAGAAVSGIWETAGERPTRVKDSRTTIFGLSAERPRKVVAVHEGRSLAGKILVTGNETGPVRTRLQLKKSAAVRGARCG